MHAFGSRMHTIGKRTSMDPSLKLMLKPLKKYLSVHVSARAADEDEVKVYFDWKYGS